MLAVGREDKAGADVFGREFRKRLADFACRHAGDELIQYIIDRDPCVAHTGLARTQCRIDCDEV